MEGLRRYATEVAREMVGQDVGKQDDIESVSVPGAIHRQQEINKAFSGLLGALDELTTKLLGPRIPEPATTGNNVPNAPPIGLLDHLREEQAATAGMLRMLDRLISAVRQAASG